MSMVGGKATLVRDYGKRKTTAIADATGTAVLAFGYPPQFFSWIVHRMFFRAGAGATFRLFVGSDPISPGTANPADEVDAVTVNPARSSGEEIEVDPLEQIWVLITGVAAGTACSGQIRFRIAQWGGF